MPPFHSMLRLLFFSRSAFHPFLLLATYPDTTGTARLN